MSDLVFDARQITAFGAAMAAAPAELKREMQVASAALLAEGVGLMQGFAPVDEGTLRGSMRILSGPTPEGGAFGTSLVYARQRNYGGTIHGRPWLVFRTKAGNWVKVRSVTQRGAHFKERTEAALRTRVQRTYAAAVRRVLARIGKAAD